MIGKRIQQFRQQMGLSISELADRAGIAKSYLSTIERDIQGNPSIQVLEKLAGVLHVSVAELVEPNGTTEGNTVKPLDTEWLDIVRKAMESGVTKAQFQEYLAFQTWKNTQQKEE